MKVLELIEALQKMPQDALVKTSNNDGCYECNAYGIPYYHDIYEATYLKTGDYPYTRMKHLVIL